MITATLSLPLQRDILKRTAVQRKHHQSRGQVTGGAVYFGGGTVCSKSCLFLRLTVQECRRISTEQLPGVVQQTSCVYVGQVAWILLCVLPSGSSHTLTHQSDSTLFLLLLQHDQNPVRRRL